MMMMAQQMSLCGLGQGLTPPNALRHFCNLTEKDCASRYLELFEICHEKLHI